MIRYALCCTEGHGFDSWFQSAAAFDRLAAAGLNHCPVCGSTQTEKVLMAPALAMAGNADGGGAESGGAEAGGAEAAPAKADARLEELIAGLRRQIEEGSDYVGKNFAAEARRMHEGEEPARSIWGEARGDEVLRLLQDGVPVAPLPFIPRRKTN